MQRNGDADFARRLINGITFASNPAHLERAKERLTEAILEVADILGEGECTEVYRLNAQLIPLTQIGRKKS